MTVAAGERRERRVPGAVPPQALHDEIGRLFGDAPVRRDLAAYDRDQSFGTAESAVVAATLSLK